MDHTFFERSKRICPLSRQNIVKNKLAMHAERRIFVNVSYETNFAEDLQGSIK